MGLVNNSSAENRQGRFAGFTMGESTRDCFGKLNDKIGTDTGVVEYVVTHRLAAEYWIETLGLCGTCSSTRDSGKGFTDKATEFQLIVL